MGILVCRSVLIIFIFSCCSSSTTNRAALEDTKEEKKIKQITYLNSRRDTLSTKTYRKDKTIYQEINFLGEEKRFICYDSLENANEKFTIMGSNDTTDYIRLNNIYSEGMIVKSILQDRNGVELGIIENSYNKINRLKKSIYADKTGTHRTHTNYEYDDFKRPKKITSEIVLNENNDTISKIIYRYHKSFDGPIWISTINYTYKMKVIEKYSLNKRNQIDKIETITWDLDNPNDADKRQIKVAYSFY